MKVILKMFILVAVCAFTFALLMAWAPWAEHHIVLFDNTFPIKWWHAIVAVVGILTFKSVK